MKPALLTAAPSKLPASAASRLAAAGGPLLATRCSLLATAFTAAAAAVATISAFQPFSLSALCADAPRPHTPRPNIIIFLADDMGYSQPGCYGGTLAPTPNIDALAAAGARFTSGYASAPVCSPSRAALMTGRYQQRTGQDNLINEQPSRFLPLTETLLPQLLKQAGYATAMIGKWHLGHTEGYRPIDRGFDTYYGTYNNKNEVKTYVRQSTPIPKPPIDSPVFAAEAIKFIDAHRAAHPDTPLFLYLPFTAVHNPIQASPEWLQKFSKTTPPRDRDYAAMVAELDAAIGAVMAAIRKHHLEENTLVIFTSDNGAPAGDGTHNKPLSGGKWSLLEGGIREPYIVQWKTRIPPGRVVETPVSQMDIFPTALAAAGATIPATLTLDGVNLLPLLQNQTTTLPRDALYWRYGPQYAIRQGDYKLVKSERNQPAALYNIAKDPSEKKNLIAADPARAKTLQTLWDAWNATMLPPRWTDPRSGGLNDRQTNFAAPKKEKKGDKQDRKDNRDERRALQPSAPQSNAAPPSNTPSSIARLSATQPSWSRLKPYSDNEDGD